MSIRTPLIATGLIAASLVSGTAHAVLQGRDLNGSTGSFEAYYDTVLNITWLADANYAKTSGYDADGYMTWAAATTWVANLSFTDGINVYDNWRLPTVSPINGSSFNYALSFNGSTDVGYNVSAPGTAYAGSTGSEMAYMFYNNLGNPAYYTPAGAVSGCLVSSSNTCLDNVGPFSNLQSNSYWSATAQVFNTDWVWIFNFGNGGQGDAPWREEDGPGGEYVENYHFNALAVSPGDVGAVPEAQTYALMLAGLGLIGWRARRRG